MYSGVFCNNLVDNTCLVVGNLVMWLMAQGSFCFSFQDESIDARVRVKNLSERVF